MKTQHQIPSASNVRTRQWSLGVAAMILISSCPNSSAGTVTLQLLRTSLTNVTDTVGMWQHEGGNIKKSSVTIGKYVIVRRVTKPATSPQGAAVETITLLIGTPSELNNITLQGAHHFDFKNFKGSVSAASNQYSWLIGADSGYISTGAITSSLTMNWLGANHLTVP